MAELANMRKPPIDTKKSKQQDSTQEITGEHSSHPTHAGELSSHPTHDTGGSVPNLES